MYLSIVGPPKLGRYFQSSPGLPPQQWGESSSCLCLHAPGSQMVCTKLDWSYPSSKEFSFREYLHSASLGSIKIEHQGGLEFTMKQGVLKSFLQTIPSSPICKARGLGRGEQSWASWAPWTQDPGKLTPYKHLGTTLLSWSFESIEEHK